MSAPHSATCSRRDFLQRAIHGGVAVGVLPLLAACGSLVPLESPTSTPPPPTVEPSATPTPVPTSTATATPVLTATPTPSPTVTPTASPTRDPRPPIAWWWWGEQEIPGLQQWVEESVQIYRLGRGATVEPTILDTSMVVTQFQAAASRQEPPDIQVLWNGIYHMESVWMGFLQPLNGLISDDLLAASNPTALSTYDGKQWRMGWYAVPMLWLANRQLFERAGLNPDAAPDSFDALLDACSRLRSSGVTPIAAGLADGFWGEWQTAHSLSSFVDSPGEALELFTGVLDWHDPRYSEHWARSERLLKSGAFDEDLLSLSLGAGIERFAAGKAAMCAVSGPSVAALRKRLGPDTLLPFVYPGGGSSKLAGRPILDTQGLGIAASSRRQVEAADFLTFLHTPERVQAFWDQVRQLPSDTTWSGSGIYDPLVKQVSNVWVKADNAIPPISTLMPTLFWSDAIAPAYRKLASGEYSAENAAENANGVARVWRSQYPEFLDLYARWAAELKQ